MFGFYRIATIAPKLYLADIDKNVQEISRCIQELTDCALLLFPELSLTGYTLGDLFYQEIVREKVVSGLDELRRGVLESIVVVGAPLWHGDRLYNCAVVMQHQKILGIVPKSYLANYREFYEKRWFSSGRDLKGEYLLDAPFGSDLLFRAGKITFGVEICEDLWSLIPPSSSMAASGANLILNLSASDEEVGKESYRKELVLSQSARGVCAYAYASSSIGESSADVIYGGSLIIAENGTLLAKKRSFAFESEVITADVDIEKLRAIRASETSFKDAPKANYRYVECEELPKPKEIKRFFTPHPFIPGDKAKRDEVCEEIFTIQSSALARRLVHIGYKTKLVIGVSGGLDSTLALLVCKRSCEILQKSLKDIVAISMPGFGTTSDTKRSAARLCEAMGVEFDQIDITPALLQHFKDIAQEPQVCDVTFENAQARERTQILMDMANKVGGIVIGTADLSEVALGFSTYNGDHMAMYNVNAGVPKTLVRYLIEWVASKEIALKDILQEIIDRPISPELLPTQEDKIVQKTEEIIGPYELHDFFLYHFLKYGASPKKIAYIAQLAFKEYSQEEIKKWLRLFLKRFFANQFKRDAMPDGVKVGTIALSPRGDWRMPSDAVVDMWIRDLDEDIEVIVL